MQRPNGVTLIAIFQIGVGILAIVWGLIVFGWGSAGEMHHSFAVLHDMPNGGRSMGVMWAIGAFLGIILLALGVLYIVLGVGLLKLRNWARLLTLVFTALGALLHLIRMMHSLMRFMVLHAFWQGIVIAICVLIIWYLLQPDVKRAFGET